MHFGCIVFNTGGNTMKAKLLFLLPAIAMLIACDSNKESNQSQQTGSSETSEGQTSESSSSGQATGDYQTVTFSPSDFGEAMANQGNFEATSQGLNLNATNSKLHQVYNSTDIELRVYAGGSITFSATSITGITFTTEEPEGGKYGADCLSTETGTYSASGTTGTWTGDAASVKFDSESKQTRITSFTVTYK